MKVIDVLYYQFYIFYKTVLKIKDPDIATMLAISEIVIVPILLILFFVLAINYQYVMPFYLFLGLDAILIMPFYYYFIKKRKGELIIQKMPLLLGSRFISLCFSWLIHLLFFLLLLGLFKYSYLLDLSKY